MAPAKTNSVLLNYIVPMATVAIVSFSGNGLPTPSLFASASYAGPICGQYQLKPDTKPHYEIIARDREQYNIFNNFARKFLANSVDMDSDFAQLLQDNMWDII